MKKQTVTESSVRAFARNLYENEKSPATIQKYTRDLRFFAIYANGRAVNKSLVLEYKAHLAHKYALTSANSMLAALNAFLRTCGRVDCIVKQFKVQQQTFCPAEKELSKTEYFALVKAAVKKKKERLSLLIQTLCATGMRVSEISCITVSALQKGYADVSCKGKKRRVFIVPELQKKLLRYAKKHKITKGMIFVTKTGRAIDRSNVWAEMKKLCRDAGVSARKVFPHNLRHLFARTFYNLEKDVAKLADILGHSNINTTRIYTVSSGREHRRKMENMRLII